MFPVSLRCILLWIPTWGCLKSRLLFRQPREFKIKSLYNNDLILNIALKSKETVQKLKFLDGLLQPFPQGGAYFTRFDKDSFFIGDGNNAILHQHLACCDSGYHVTAVHTEQNVAVRVTGMERR